MIKKLRNKLLQSKHWPWVHGGSDICFIVMFVISIAICFFCESHTMYTTELVSGMTLFSSIFYPIIDWVVCKIAKKKFEVERWFAMVFGVVFGMILSIFMIYLFIR